MVLERLASNCSIEDILGVFEKRPGCVFLDSGSHEYGLGRYSILACDPFKEIVAWGSRIEIREGSACRELRGNPFDVLREETAKERVSNEGDFPFSGGAIGYVAYDAGRERVEGLEDISPDFRFGFYEEALVWDHESKELHAVVRSGAKDKDWFLSRLKELVAKANAGSSQATFEIGEISSNFTREVYMERVGKTRELIRAGEIYQANLSQRFRGSFKGSGLALYRRLRNSNPAPYAAYLNFGDEQVLSSSPERFFYLNGQDINTRPIKGTRPRGANADEEAAFRKDLEHSEKDRAELLMIVDLERNDLGRICEPGSIAVKSLFELETYASVIHQTATVEGRLKPDLDAIDCFGAMFPGGSITGAPKIRAMEVIEELETGNRGVYTGAIGYIGFDGRADFNIAIRTMRIADGELSFNVGGGIVWDSDPKSEYEETLHKAKSLFDALGVTRNED